MSKSGNTKCHNQTAGIFHCKGCNFETSFLISWKKHVRKFHSVYSTQEQVCSGIKQLKCCHCSFKTMYKINLKLHLFLKHKVHKKRQNLQMDFFNCAQNNLNMYKCKICDFEVDQFLLLNKHVQELHRPQQGSFSKDGYLTKSYVCEKSTFQTYSLLHWLRHTIDCNLHTLPKIVINNLKPQLESRKDPEAVSTIKTGENNEDNNNITNPIVVRKQLENQPLEEPEDYYVQCPKCQNFYSRKSLPSHIPTCSLPVSKNKGPLNMIKIQQAFFLLTIFANGDIKRYKITKISLGQGPTDHMNSSEQFYCKDCNYDTSLLVLWNEHMRKFHRLIPRQDTSSIKINNTAATLQTQEINEKRKIHTRNVDSAKKFFECRHCSYATESREVLKKHFFSEHKCDMDHADSSKKLFGCDQRILRIYHCSYCIFKTKLLSLLKQHIKDLHSSKQTILTKTYVCKPCDYFTSSSLHWLKHCQNCKILTDPSSSPKSPQIQLVKLPDTSTQVTSDGISTTSVKQTTSPEISVEKKSDAFDNKSATGIFEKVAPRSGSGTNTTETPCNEKKKYPPTRFCCLFCKKLLTKVPVHFGRKHRNEPEVIKLLSLKKGSKERKDLMRILRRKGNFEYNQSHSKNPIVVRRNLDMVSDEMEILYTPCAICKGYYSRKSLRNHFRNCSKSLRKKEETVSSLGKTTNVKKFSSSRKKSSSVKKIVSRVRKKLSSFDRETVFLPAHGESSSTAKEESSSTVKEDLSSTLKEESSSTVEEESSSTLKEGSSSTLKGESSSTLKGESSLTLNEESFSTMKKESSSTVKEESSSLKKKSKGKNVVEFRPKKHWTRSETDAAKRLFGSFIEKGQVPNLTLCENAVKSEKDLMDRTGIQLKTWLYYRIKDAEKGESRMRHPWTTAEKLIVRQLFGEHIRNKIYPSGSECMDAINRHPELSRRTVNTLKSFLQHDMRQKSG